jgi:uncharacterized protein
MILFRRARARAGRSRSLLGLMTGALVFLGLAGAASPRNEPYPVFGESWVSQLGAARSVQYWPQVMVPMRDGVRLSTDILLPKDAARPYPTVLVRTPYPKGGTFAHGSERELLLQLISGGYAIVVQNERGAFPSEGEYHYLSNARHDGYDTVEWIIKQPWSNGRVATYGCSSPAENQMALSAANPPGLVAMIPKAAGAGIGHFPGTWNQGLFYDGGIPEFEFIPWYHSWAWIDRLQPPQGLSGSERSRLMQFYLQSWQNPPDMPLLPAAWHLPVEDILRSIGTPRSDWDTFIRRSPGEPAWRHEQMLTMYDHPREPALIVSSWHDIGTWPEIKEFQYEQSRAPDQFLIMGPTGHCLMGTETAHTMVGQEDVGDARFDYNAVYMQWFNHWLKGEHDGALSRPKVEYYLINASKWLTAPSWPPPALAQRLYLESGRGANSVFGDGTLQASRPKRPGSDSYRDDPADPVPTIDRYFQPNVVADQKLIAARHDVLVYTSAPLQNNLDVVGDVTAKLYVSSSTKDTDLMLRLVDVFPDGRAYNVRDEVLRLRYRNGFQSPQLMSPGKVYPINLQGIVTATRFRRGHRIRIQITGSDFPLLERNLNTGGDNETGVKLAVADVRIYHGGARASYVTLPVLAH